ncbi:MAG TPA: class I SAM-dependent methyltransferase [Anaerolineae bacterium]|nr:class I SAM-dependent methyltransferase [Anaerolineae bacterium]
MVENLHPDAQKWNEIFRQEGDAWLARQPRQLLLDYAEMLPRQGLALDAAAGGAIHGRYLAELGLHVIALDISEVGLRLARQRALAQGLWLEAAVYDLAHPWFPPNCFDVIVNFRFLERATFPIYRRALKPGGWLVFETFVRTDTAVPSPAHYLNPGELKAAFADWEIAHYADTAVPSPDCRLRQVEQLVARKPRAA